MGYIEKIHAKNFELIAKEHIIVGSIFQKGCFVEVVTSIHPLYGWIKTNKKDAQKLPQEVEKIFHDGWAKVNISL